MMLALQVPDPLISIDHGIMASAIIAINYTLRLIGTQIRKRHRNDSLEVEVEKIVHRLQDARNGQMAYANAMDDATMRELQSKVDEIERGQDLLVGKFHSLATSLEEVKYGIIKIVSLLRPSLVKDLDLGKPISR